MSVVGVFDSGIGGLTVASAISQALPNVDLLYLGDTARLPYGTKSPDTVTRYALKCVSFLAERGVQALVVACNTASACALPAIGQQYPGIPVLGVVDPGARAAVEATRSGRIGVIGTEGTIMSGSYTRAIAGIDPSMDVISSACPLLVPLAEVGWLEHPVTDLTLTTYLEPMLEASIDTLVLACTHYPVLKPAVRRVLDRLAPANEIILVDSAEVVTADLVKTLGHHDGDGNRSFYVTDLAQRFFDVAHTFWPGNLPTIVHVDL
ncbi:MAG TPA: glutamate racemase [Myxococcales bacterium]|nr:glutamate racemase [Myxococcales bacterium]